MASTTPQQHLSIVTGASRGLGLAVVEQLLARGHRVLALARQATVVAAPSAAALTVWTADLADTLAVAQRLSDWLAQQDAAALASATLVNNAGAVTTPSPLSTADPQALSAALRVNLEAPMLLTAAFLRATAAWTVPRKVLLVSSGLGRRAMAGSAGYNASKAGLDHLARSVALEEADKPHGARIVSLAPGVIDTDMQVQLRSADAAAFPERQRFADLKANGQLASPAHAASKLIAVLDRADFGSNPVADVRDA